MALAFNFKPVATLKAKSATSSDMVSINGITIASTTPENAAEQVNKILGVGGLSVVADTNMTRTQIQEAEET